MLDALSIKHELKLAAAFPEFILSVVLFEPLFVLLLSQLSVIFGFSKNARFGYCEMP
mgnify:CR=1 FL=1